MAAANGVTRIDVRLEFIATTMLWLQTKYLAEEISTWRGEELESVAVNTRYLVGDHIIRQQWDEFTRQADGMEARRVQAKTLDDFRSRHPGFVQHWDPVTFGQPWLDDYASATPERRADLDLKGSPLPDHLRSPLAMAFYWLRWLPNDGQNVAVFLPGFKKDRLADLAITGVTQDDGMTWRAPLHNAALSAAPISVATARTSRDRHLMQLGFVVHMASGSARGQIDAQGCEGVPVRPR